MNIVLFMVRTSARILEFAKRQHLIEAGRHPYIDSDMRWRGTYDDNGKLSERTKKIIKEGIDKLLVQHEKFYLPLLTTWLEELEREVKNNPDERDQLTIKMNNFESRSLWWLLELAGTSEKYLRD